MASKNFLDQFSTNNKPDSFKEEVLVPSSKSKKPLNITLIVIIVIVILLGGFLTWFFVLRPTIEVPSFIGQEVSDVNSWLKQQGIQASGVVFKDEYSEEYDEKIIINQSIEEGKKVKKDVKIDFTVSKGPDPNVEVKVPDIISMNLREIESWIDANKLSGIKITYEFSDEDPLDSVISYEFGSNASETNFKRSSSLTIVVSKGSQEDQPISVPNFVGKNVSEVTNWGSKNKIKIKQQEGYSSTVNKDMIISQSVNPGKKITSKEALTVTVSKGEAIYAPDFSGYSRENIQAWGEKNSVNVEIIEKYSKDVAKNKVIEQSNKDKPVNDGMTVTISKGNISKDDFFSKYGDSPTYDDLEKWVNEVNNDGANLILKSEKFPHKNSDEVIYKSIGLDDFEVGSTLKGFISNGKLIFLDGEWVVTNEGQPVADAKEADARTYCEGEKKLTCKFKYIENYEGNIEVSGIIKVYIGTDTTKTPNLNTYISQSDIITIEICRSKLQTTPE